MKTTYKVIVAHDDVVNPDGFVDTAETVLNHIVQLPNVQHKQSVWLLRLMNVMGELAHTQLLIEDVVSNPDLLNQVPDVVRSYEQLLITLCGMSQTALTQFNENIERAKHDTTHTDEQ